VGSNTAEAGQVCRLDAAQNCVLFFGVYRPDGRIVAEPEQLRWHDASQTKFARLVQAHESELP
jgi:hypothetical protein